MTTIEALLQKRPEKVSKIIKLRFFCLSQSLNIKTNNITRYLILQHICHSKNKTYLVLEITGSKVIALQYRLDTSAVRKVTGLCFKQIEARNLVLRQTIVSGTNSLPFYWFSHFSVVLCADQSSSYKTLIFVRKNLMLRKRASL